jgi:hypothetical protein
MPDLIQEQYTPNRGTPVRDMTDDDSGLFDDSRRSFMKKGALATTAIALGAGATAGTSAAQDDNGNGDVVVFGEDYLPGVDFDVASQADTGTRDDVYEATGLDDEFSDPDDWDLFFIAYDTGGSSPTLGYLMAENAGISAGDSDTMGTDGSFRNAELNLIEATLGAEPDEPDEDEEEEEDEPEEPDEPDEPGNGNGNGPGGD